MFSLWAIKISKLKQTGVSRTTNQLGSRENSVCQQQPPSHFLLKHCSQCPLSYCIGKAASVQMIKTGSIKLALCVGLAPDPLEVTTGKEWVPNQEMLQILKSIHCTVFVMDLEPLQWMTEPFSRTPRNLQTIFYPFIFFHLSKVRPRWRRAKPVVPGLIPTSNAFQLLLGDAEAFPGQPGYVDTGPNPESSSRWTCPEHL